MCLPGNRALLDPVAVAIVFLTLHSKTGGSTYAIQTIFWTDLLAKKDAILVVNY